jgi:DNA-binding response OmpR family regulator
LTQSLHHRKVMGMGRILVIDDDPDVRTTLGRMLETAGYEVALAADGREGVREYRAKPADVVITDLYMPNREGLETITELRLLFPAVAIIAMSGRAAAAAMLSIAQKLGAIEILQKPFTSQELLAAVAKVLPKGATPA